MVTLSNSLHACPVLLSLDIRHNYAGEAGTVALGHALRAGACPRLQSLHTSANAAGEAGIVALSDALRAGACPRLQALDIERNNAGEAEMGRAHLGWGSWPP